MKDYRRSYEKHLTYLAQRTFISFCCKAAGLSVRQPSSFSAVNMPETSHGIAQEIVDMSNEKRTLRNKQDEESKDRIKQLKRHIEKKIRWALKSMITKSFSSAKMTSEE